MSAELNALVNGLARCATPIRVLDQGMADDVWGYVLGFIDSDNGGAFGIQVQVKGFSRYFANLPWCDRAYDHLTPLLRDIDLLAARRA